VNKELIIDKTYYGKDSGEHISMKDIMEWKID